MNAPENDDVLLRGDRVPNFTLGTADGRLLLFYEYAVVSFMYHDERPGESEHSKPSGQGREAQ